jgi:Primosomal protein N'' (replication factor Y) - superfamily II helicase
MLHAFIAKLIAMSNDSYPQTVGRDIFGAGERVRVLLPLPLAEAYEYRVGDDLTLSLGDFVTVPLGRRLLTGVVWGTGSGVVEEARLRPVAGRFAVPPLPEPSRRFVDWVAAYTVDPPGAVLRMAMSVTDALVEPPGRTVYALAESPPADSALTPARRRVIEVLAAGPPRPRSRIRGADIGLRRRLRPTISAPLPRTRERRGGLKAAVSSIRSLGIYS